MNRNSTGALSAHHTLLTASWTAEVEAMEASIERVAKLRRPTSNCRVTFFEIAGDAHLHVNVTHGLKTKGVRGWAGPAIVPEGFVHNRLFDNTSAREIVGQIRQMVFAESE